MHKTLSKLQLSLIAVMLLSHSPLPSEQDATVRTLRSQALPAMNGKKLEVKLIEVSYPPGGASRAHSHPCTVFGYVLEGALRSQVQGQAEATYRPGDSFYEAPNGVHAVSANASSSEPVRFLVTFVCDSSAPLTTPVPPK